MSASDDDNRSTANGDEGSRPEPTREQRAAQMPDELKVDVDQDKLRAWDDAKGDYGVKDDSERPIMVGEGEPEPMRSDDESAEETDEETDEESDDQSDDTSDDESESTDADEDHHTSRPDHENRSSAEPTDGQQT